MKKKLNCVMLIDDNPDDNFYHRIIIEDLNLAKKIIVQETATNALEYFENEKGKPAEKQLIPDLIFLDINMLGMNGFEFLEEYNMSYRNKHKTSVIMMLTTSSALHEKRKAEELGVKHFISKPLIKDSIPDFLNDL